MKIPYSALPAIRTTILLAFTALSVFVFGYFWTSVGGQIPLVTRSAYQVRFPVDRVNNLVPQSDVTVSGIKVGKVLSVTPTPDGHASVLAEITDQQVVPLHDGLGGRINAKTLVEETYVSLNDGSGAPLADGATLPAGAVAPAVTIDDVVRALPADSRTTLAHTLQSLAAGTTDTKAGVDGVLKGLGALGREGGTALDALAAQSDSLRKLSSDTAAVLEALDTRQGQIADLVRDANTVTQATSAGSEDIKAIMRELPGVLTTARDASDDLTKLSQGLSPVAANLNRAAPSLDDALTQLPDTSRDLRGLLPSLDATLGKAPTTLDKVPDVADDLDALVPHANEALAQLNPMLHYLQPYGHDIAPFFTSFGWAVSRGDANGTLLRVMPIFNKDSFKGNPVPLNDQPDLDTQDPYPGPGSAGQNPHQSPPPDPAMLAPSRTGD
jgi:phospholipid/cholesterol/gamma-HCH transport system substrate-binding protein